MGGEPFETIMSRHHGEIFRYLRRVSAGAAEDLSQETFLRAYRAYSALPADANVRAWLFAIATNLARNNSRNEKRRRIAHEAIRERRGSDGDGPEGAARFNEARAAMDRVIGGLPLKQRAAFILRKFHDLPYEEIGRSLTCSPESARAHVFHAFRKIRQSVNGYQLPGTAADQ